MRVRGLLLLLALPSAVGALGRQFGGAGDVTSWGTRPATAPSYVRSWRVQGEQVVLETQDGTQRVPLAPARIVSALPGITEALAWMGAGPQLVAVSPWCDTPEFVRRLPKVRILPLDVEGLIASRPDLVVVDRRLVQRDLELLRARVPAVLVLETSHGLSELGDAMEILAEVLDTETARGAVRGWREQLAKIQAGSRPAARRVLLIAQWDPLYALGPGALLDDLARHLGLDNVACDLIGGSSGPFSEELVLVRQPEVLLHTQPVPDAIRARWRCVPAVRDAQIIDVGDDLFVRGGPRSLDALERLRAALQARQDAPTSDLREPR